MRAAPRLGDGRHELRVGDRRYSEGEDADDRDAEQDQQRTHGARLPERRERGERQHESSERERRAAGEGDHAVVPDEDTGGRQPMEAEQRGHHRERAPDEDGAAVLRAHTGDDQRDSGDDCQRRAERNAEEVNATGRSHLLAPDEVQGSHRYRGERSDDDEDRDRAISHKPKIGRSGRFV